MKNIKIDELMRKNPVTLRPDNTAYDAARVMREERIGCILVCEPEGGIAGMITDRDLTVEMLAEGHTGSTPLSTVMSPAVSTVEETAGVDDVIAVMEENGVRRVPVVQTDRQGYTRCKGVISVDDLIAREAISIKQLSNIIRPQLNRVEGRVTEKRRTPSETTARSARPGRAKSRRDQTLTLFYRAVTKETDLERPEAELLTHEVLSYLLGRLTRNEAYDLLSQLPGHMKDEFEQYANGPDRSITAESLVANAAEAIGLEEIQIRDLMVPFRNALEKYVSPGEIGDVLAQLPEDLYRLFEPGGPYRRKAA